MKNYLDLYRRHASSCTRGYSRDHRIYKPVKEADEQKDCSCPIHATGRLKKEPKRILHKVILVPDPVLGKEVPTSYWDQAEKVKKQWLSWEQTTPPKEGGLLINPTIKQAWERFVKMGVLGGKQCGAKQDKKSTLSKYDQFLRYRLMPWCATRGGVELITFKIFETFEIVEDFVSSWRNCNPHRNKKVSANAQKRPDGGGWLPPETEAHVPLGDSSAKAERERLSAFLNYGVRHNWISQNLVKQLGKPETDIQPKFGLTFQEVDQIFDAITKYPDCYGRIEQNRQQQARILTFVLTLRYTGIRIGDGAMFNSGWMKRNPEGTGYYVYIPNPQKTGHAVNLPMDDELAQALLALPYKFVKDGVGYWFWTGEGTPDTCTGIWQRIMYTLYHKAQEPNPNFDPMLPVSDNNNPYLKPFEHHTTPHTWRHTFAILSLALGHSIEDVSRWLGHSSVLITRKHYGHANSSMIMSDIEKLRRFREKQDELLQNLKKSGQEKVVQFPVRKIG